MTLIFYISSEGYLKLQILDRASISFLSKYSSILSSQFFSSSILVITWKLELALIECEKLIEHDAENANGYYNKACVKARLGNADEAILLLDKAINIDPQFRSIAKSDEDFKSISRDTRFIKLISE